LDPPEAAVFRFTLAPHRCPRCQDMMDVGEDACPTCGHRNYGLEASPFYLVGVAIFLVAAILFVEWPPFREFVAQRGFIAPIDWHD
jgi:hypothetical protein